MPGRLRSRARSKYRRSLLRKPDGFFGRGFDRSGFGRTSGGVGSSSNGTADASYRTLTKANVLIACCKIYWLLPNGKKQ